MTTGTKRGAGTDADVKISLIGTKGHYPFFLFFILHYTLMLNRTDDHLLDNDKNNFEAGKVDHFLIDSIFLFKCLGLFFSAV